MDSIDIEILLKLEEIDRKVFRVKKIYVDIAGSLMAGILLGQIIYWHLPGENGKSRLRVIKEGKRWLAKQRDDWWEEIRMTEREYDTAVKKLEKRDLIEKKYFMFNGKRTTHLRLKTKKLERAYNKELAKDKNYSQYHQTIPETIPDKSHGDKEQQMCKTGLNKSVKPVLPDALNRSQQMCNSITENTTEITAKILTERRYNGQEQAPAPPTSFSFPFNHFQVKHLIEARKNKIDIRKNTEYYIKKYRETRGQEHPALTLEQWTRVFDNITGYTEQYYDSDLVGEAFEKVADQHFKTNYKNCDYNILHFISGKIRENRAFEADCY